MDIRINNSVSSAMIKGESYNVLTYDEYRNSQALWDMGSIAVIEEKDGDKYVLPYRGEYTESKSLQPGIYSAGSLDFEVLPKASDEDTYKNIPVITISSNDDIQTILEKEKVLSKLAEPWISSPDNITVINVKETDGPGMKCLKTAINNKHCDMDRYGHKFGQNFPNDKRQLKNDEVTIKIIDRYCRNMDMEAILTIRDKNPQVANPIGEPVSVSLLTGEFMNITIDDENVDYKYNNDIDDESSDEDDDF